MFLQLARSDDAKVKTGAYRLLWELCSIGAPNANVAARHLEKAALGDLKAASSPEAVLCALQTLRRMPLPALLQFFCTPDIESSIIESIDGESVSAVKACSILVFGEVCC